MAPQVTPGCPRDTSSPWLSSLARVSGCAHHTVYIVQGVTQLHYAQEGLQGVMPSVCLAGQLCCPALPPTLTHAAAGCDKAAFAERTPPHSLQQ